MFLQKKIDRNEHKVGVCNKPTTEKDKMVWQCA